MSNDIMRYDDGRVTWSQSVERIARVLNPLGEAATITANLGACAAELSRLRNEAARLRIAHKIFDAIMKERAREVLFIYELQKRHMNERRASGSALRAALNAMTGKLHEVGIPSEDRLIAMNLLPVLSTSLAAFHQHTGSEIIELSKVLRLDSVDFTAVAVRQYYGSA